jgi:hypothetical protein
MSPESPPDFAAARDHVVGQVVSFARTLRAAGAHVPANASLDAARALVEVGLDDRERVRSALRTTLLSDPRDAEAFETHFPAFWYRLRSGLEAAATADAVGDRSDAAGGLSARGDEDPAAAADAATNAEDGGDGGGGSPADETVRARRLVDHDAEAAERADEESSRTGAYSPVGAGTAVEDDGASASAVDEASLKRFVRSLSTLAGRRWTPSGRGDAVDARRALRESVGTGGVALSLPTRERAPAALQCTVLVDVSQSVLDTLDRGFLLSFLDALVAESRAARVFFFDTDVREVTGAFERSGGDPVAALTRAEVSWGGGTKIGASLASIRSRWPDAVDRRTVTLVVSDGLDVGDDDSLSDGMAWLARRSKAVLWLNPLAASAAYEPTCRGMATARPYVDGLFAFAGSADLAEMARQLERYGAGGSVGYEHDFRDRRGASP